MRRSLPFALSFYLLAAPSAHGDTGVCTQLTDSLPTLEFSSDPQLELTADSVDASADGLSRLLGSVRLRQGDKELTADQLDFDETERVVQINAESLFRNRELTIRSSSAELDLDDETGLFNNTEFVLPQRAARGDSNAILLSRAGTADLDGVRYTTCAPDSNAWYLEAGSIHLDHEEGLGTARNARLRLMGVPIFYAPWFQFPIDDRRRTGLLFPTIGRSDRTGWDFRQPVYLNLAPNYDATLTPRFMSDRGLQINGEGRYLMPRAEGSMGYEYLENDNQNGETRAYGYFNHLGLISRRLGADIRFAEASDRSYFEDFGGNIDLSAITHLERSARFTYAAPAAYTVQMLLQDYQTISSNLATTDDPYQRLPQVRFDAITRNAVWDTRAGIEGEYVNFARDSSTEGQRVDLHPYLRMEKDWLAWFIKSQVDFRYTAYELAGESALQSQNPDRALYSYSAEYGLRFERITSGGAVQTMEPHVFYLYTPYENQDDLPIFDSGEPDFDYTQLFARNRYSGADRISDANHMAIAVTGRHLDSKTGAELVSGSIGQLFRFTAPRVQLPDDSSPQQGATDFIGSLDYHLSETLSVGLDTQWSPENAEFSRSSVALRYHSDLRTLQLAYRYRAGLLEQADVLLATPLYNGVSVLGRWRYSLSDRQSLDTVAGLQYETCCWGVQAAYRRYVSNTAGDFNSGIYLQLELKGLARVGTGFQNLLPHSAVE